VIAVHAMKPRHLLDLVLLAALWGASFLFMRVAAPEFGPLALIELRVGIAAVFLLVVLAARGRLRLLGTHAAPMAVVGVINSALPFSLLAYATLSVTAGFASILNATNARAAGMGGHLSKPVNLPLLSEVLQSMAQPQAVR
jgi:drug/metabolite transporter (DMT)-like permease